MKPAIKPQSNSTALIVATGLFALGGAATSPQAQAADQRPLSKIVSYGDLNIDSEQGAKVLYARLRSAARDVCFPLESRDLIRSRWQRCFDDALGSAVGQVNEARLTAMHNQAFRHSSKS